LDLCHKILDRKNAVRYNHNSSRNYFDNLSVHWEIFGSQSTLELEVDAVALGFCRLWVLSISRLPFCHFAKKRRTHLGPKAAPKGLLDPTAAPAGPGSLLDPTAAPS
jgi:hypothetical protein